MPLQRNREQEGQPAEYIDAHLIGVALVGLRPDIIDSVALEFQLGDKWLPLSLSRADASELKDKLDKIAILYPEFFQTVTT